MLNKYKNRRLRRNLSEGRLKENYSTRIPIRKRIKEFKSEFLNEHNNYLERRFQKKRLKMKKIKKSIAPFDHTLLRTGNTSITHAYSDYEDEGKKYLMKGKNVVLQFIGTNLIDFVTYDRKKRKLTTYKVTDYYERGTGDVEIDLDSELSFDEDSILNFEKDNEYKYVPIDYDNDILDKLYYIFLVTRFYTMLVKKTFP